MPTTYKILGNGTEPTADLSYNTFYTVPAATSAIVSAVVVANASGAAAGFGIRVRKASGSVVSIVVPYAAGNLANATRVSFNEGWTLATGDSIQFLGSTTGLNYTVFGTEIS